MEVGPREGFAMEFRAQFDRKRFPARGRSGGAEGGPTVVQLSDGTDFPAKARFPVPEGQTVRLAFPGGGGMGSPSERDLQAVARDVRLGYVSEEAAKRDYGWTP
jgi:N-methylhydantoinase B